MTAGNIPTRQISYDPLDQVYAIHEAQTVTDEPKSCCQLFGRWVKKHSGKLAIGMMVSASLVGTGVASTILSARKINTLTAPLWSYTVVNTLSVSAMLTAAAAPLVQLSTDWRNYRRDGTIPNAQSNSWLIIDFLGRSSVLGMLLTQSLAQNVALTPFNFLTPGAAIVIELLVIGSTLYFRHKGAKQIFPIDDVMLTA